MAKNMLDDSWEPFERLDIGPGGIRGRLAEEIEKAQAFIIPSTRTRMWVQRLRFLVPAQRADLGYDFELVTDSINSPEPYIAVSYCWRPSAADVTRESKRPIPKVLTHSPRDPASKIRDAKVRPDVLYRSFRFAAKHGVQRVWIDQECIDQDDREDKENGIQSMDLLYRQARYTLAILDRHFENKTDVENLAGSIGILRLPDSSVTPDEEEEDMPFHFDAMITASEKACARRADMLADSILSDRWFTRAWTTQEFMVSVPESMTFIVAWNEEEEGLKAHWEYLRKKATRDRKYRYFGDVLQSVWGEWRLDCEGIWWLSTRIPDSSNTEIQRGGRNLVDRNALFHSLRVVRYKGPRYSKTYRLSEIDISRLEWLERKEDDIAILTGDSTAAEGESYGVPGDVSPSSGPLSGQYFSMFASDAIGILRSKFNSRTADRLAILGNICNYRWRIDTRAAEDNNLSFSACTIALALYNGDTSLLFSNTTEESWNLVNKLIPRWLPTETASLSGLKTDFSLLLTRNQKGGRPCLALGGRLVIEGLLWHISPFQFSQSAQEKMRALMATKPTGDIVLAVSDLNTECLQLLVGELLTLKRKDILDAIIARCVHEQFNSPAQVLQIISRLEEWFHGKGPWPGEDGGSLIMGDNGIEWIFVTVAAGQHLALGSCNIGEETLVAVFDCDGTRVKTVFTPLNFLEYEFLDKRSQEQIKHTTPPTLTSWCVGIYDCGLEAGEALRARNILGFQGGDGAKLEGAGESENRELHISKKILRITGFAKGAWSLRLSTAGIVVPDPELKSWRMVPLGKEAAYYFIE